jgi:hypothetical protein
MGEDFFQMLAMYAVMAKVAQSLFIVSLALLAAYLIFD